MTKRDSQSSCSLVKRLIDFPAIALSIGGVLLFVYLAARANVDLSAGRFALYMDERITFDGVSRILGPASLKDFLWAIVDGGDQRYGRSLWNLTAIVSAIPRWIWGEQGQVIAGRMIQTVLLVGSVLLLALGLLRSWFNRVVTTIVVLSIPYASYYATMPKPEPLQIFFLSIFLVFYARRQLAFGWYWVFAGLAFGTKISTLPILCVLAAGSIAASLWGRDSFFNLSQIRNALLWFCLGLTAAVPILAGPFLLWTTTYIAVNQAKDKRRWQRLAWLGITFFLALISVIASKRPGKVWIESTFLNTGHGGDQVSINFGGWVSYLFSEWFVTPGLLGQILALMLLIFVVGFGIWVLKFREEFPNNTVGFLLCISGLTLNLSIFSSVQRLWGMYLFPGTVLIVVGACVMYEALREDSTVLMRSKFITSLRISGWVTLVLMLSVALRYWWPHLSDEFGSLAARTESADYAEQYNTYAQILDVLERHSQNADRPLRVIFTPSLFPPPKSSKYEIVEFWGPYTQWDDPADLLIFGQINTPRGRATPPDSLEYSAYLAERSGYSIHVAPSGGQCKVDPCYELEATLPNGGEILRIRKVPR